MTAPSTLSEIDQYLELGFGLVHIVGTSKAPKGQGWQRNPITTKEAAAGKWQSGDNLGLHHGASGTGTLDLDRPDLAMTVLKAIGIDLEELLNGPGAKIRSAKGLKPIYRLPEGLELSRRVLAWKDPETKKMVTIFELRAGMAQDVLPPSIHPDTGKPYTWEPKLPGSREDIPELTGGLRTLWEHWGELMPMMLSALPGYVPPPPRGRKPAKDVPEGESVIDAFNNRYTFSGDRILEDHGYRAKGTGRWIAPDSSTGLAGVVLYKGDNGLEYIYSNHGSDPLNTGHREDAFGAWCILEHGGDFTAAVRAAAEDLGMSHSKGGATFTFKQDSRPPSDEAARRTSAQAAERAVDLTLYQKTDYGNAERLHALHGQYFRYCSALGYLVWDGRRWKVDDDESAMRRLALETARELYAQAGTFEKHEERDSWGKLALACEKTAALKNAVELVRTIPGVRIDVNDLDRDPMLFNVSNGTINLKTGKLKPHDPADLITKLAPVDFDPDAKATRWLEFQTTICKDDQELIAFKQQAYGYSMTGNTSEDCIFIPYGTGANGKSTELDTIGKILGEYGKVAQFDTFAVKKNEGVRNDIADLVGARFVSASEGENRQRLAEGLVKQMTGGDTMKARFLHKEYFQFKPAFKLWLATNHKPVIRGTDHGIWRRIRLIPYDVTIPQEKRDKRLKEKLDTEKSGILNWMLTGCKSWRESGLGDAKAVRDATDSYRQESDVLAEFISARCSVGGMYSEVSGDLYNAYKTWCEETTEEPFTSNLFGRLLTERGYKATQARVDGKSQKVRTGICLKTNSGEEEA